MAFACSPAHRRRWRSALSKAGDVAGVLTKASTPVCHFPNPQGVSHAVCSVCGACHASHDSQRKRPLRSIRRSDTGMGIRCSAGAGVMRSQESTRASASATKSGSKNHPASAPPGSRSTSTSGSQHSGWPSKPASLSLPKSASSPKTPNPCRSGSTIRRAGVVPRCSSRWPRRTSPATTAAGVATPRTSPRAASPHASSGRSSQEQHSDSEPMRQKRSRPHQGSRNSPTTPPTQTHQTRPPAARPHRRPPRQLSREGSRSPSMTAWKHLQRGGIHYSRSTVRDLIRAARKSKFLSAYTPGAVSTATPKARDLLTQHGLTTNHVADSTAAPTKGASRAGRTTPAHGRSSKAK